MAREKSSSSKPKSLKRKRLSESSSSQEKTNVHDNETDIKVSEVTDFGLNDGANDSEDLNALIPNASKDENLFIEKFALSQNTLDALKSRGYNTLFPIQAASFGPIRDGNDMIARARTGQGKTLAFCLPILEQLISKNVIGKGIKPHVLIMSPTRELTKQIVIEFQSIAPSNLRIESIYGGTSLDQNRDVLRRGVDIIVGTPGRVKDVIDKKWLLCDGIAHIVLDEADQMLDMGFQDEVQAIFDAMGSNPRQTCLFSATMPPWIHNLADKYLSKARVTIDLVEKETEKAGVTVSHVAMPTHWTMLGTTINDVIAMYAGRTGRVLIFCQTKLDCDTIVMDKSIKHECHVLHGDIPQAKRESTLAAFRDNVFRVLIATDVAARGLDLNVELVIQAKPPIKNSGKADVETYVHRSGRTGRAGKTGVCVTLWTPKTKYALEDVERAVGNKFEWRGAPQPLDVLHKSAANCAIELADVSKDTFPYFRTLAKELIQRMGPEEALCAALARLTGYTEKLKTISLLGSAEGMVTIQFHSSKPILATGYVFGALNREFSVELTQGIRGMRLTKDGVGACFDVPEIHVEAIQSCIDGTRGFRWLSICETLPPLSEERSFGSNGFASGGSGRSSDGRGGGRGGRFGRGGSSGRGRGFERRDGRGSGGGRWNSNAAANAPPAKKMRQGF